MSLGDSVIPNFINPKKNGEYGIRLFRRDRTNLVHVAVERPTPIAAANNNIAAIRDK